MSEYLEDKIKDLEDKVEQLNIILREVVIQSSFQKISHSKECISTNNSNEENIIQYNKRIGKGHKLEYTYNCRCTAELFNNFLRISHE